MACLLWEFRRPNECDCLVSPPLSAHLAVIFELVSMNSSVKVVLSLLILGLVGGGGYFGTVKVIDIFQAQEKSSSKKQIPVKPKNIKDKQALVETGINNDAEFTFFDILNDPSMSKFVGLSGSVVEPQEVGVDLSPDPNPKTDKKSVPSPVSSSSQKALNSVSSKMDASKIETHKVDVKKSGSSMASGYALQVGSFQKVERANLLKDKLGKKGYPVFVVMAHIPGSAEVWHRVFIGRFSQRETAVEIAGRIKTVEKLDSVMMWQEGQSPKVTP